MKRLVLLGGGHSHLLVLDHFRRQPPPGTELLLVSPTHLTAYSGMIPGLIAGDHDYRACHIDLARPAAAAGARFVQDRAVNIDPSSRTVELESGAPLSYDVLSIDVGSVSTTPARHLEDGTWVVPVRPVERFLQDMQQLWLRARQGDLAGMAVVGGGAAGVELALALHYRMNRSGKAVGMALVSETRRLVSERGEAASNALERLCRDRGVALILGASAEATTRGVTIAGAGRLDAQAVVWSTGAEAPPWLSHTGLATDPRGFVAVNERLQSVSHAEVFAAGDCASPSAPAGAPPVAALPKSGVLAVRQGPALAANLERALAGEALLPHRVSPQALAILNCGGRQALALWRGMALQGRWVWRWKRRLDRRFVRKFD